MRIRLLATACCLSFLTAAALAQEPVAAFEQADVGDDSFDVTLSEAELEESDAMVGSISGILSSTRDLYQSTAGYQFGNVRYRIKGFTSDQGLVAINGIPMNDPSTGRTQFSLWGGLNDVTRNSSVVAGIGFSEFSYGNVGGFVNYSMLASDMRKGLRATYSCGNRNYRHRAMITYNTGMMPNGWAVSVSGSRRFAEEGYVDGTFYDAWAYFAAVEKRINTKHSINFVAFGAPRTYGRSSASTKEAYELAGSNYYNPNWGYQNGKKRNANVAKYHQPFFAVTHRWTISDKLDLMTSASYNFGRAGSTSLSWFAGNDPRPDYYKNLPSYYTLTKYSIADYEANKEDWETNVNRRQLNWDRFYTSNRNSRDRVTFTQNDDTGFDITLDGHRANYYIQERRNDKQQFNLSSIFNYSFDNISWNAGLNLTVFKGYHFMTINDLLGADYYLDVDKYAVRDSLPAAGQRFPDAAHSDLNNPNKICYVGDKCGYFYLSNTNRAEAFGQMVYSLPKIEFMGGIKLQQTTMWRSGRWRNGVHADNSFGNSRHLNFTDVSLKAGATYKINGRNYAILNALYQTDPPTFQNSFETARTSNATISGLTSRKVFATDISYNVRLPKLRARASLYYSKNFDDISVRNVYIEGRDEQTSSGGVYGSYIWRNLDREHYGCEFGMEAELPASLSFSLAGGWGHFSYANRPTIQVISDNGMTNQTDIAYLKNYRIGGFPQSAVAAGLRYSRNYLNVGLTLNYFADIYMDIFPERHTEFALSGYTPDHPNWNKLTDQKKLGSNATVDLYLGKSWRISNYYLALNASVNNLLNNTKFAYSAYEQYRVDREKPDRFQPKYNYMYGTQIFVNLNFRY